MKVNNIFDVLGLIVILAITTDIVTGKNTAKVITSSANGFSSVLKSAQGK